MDVRAGDLVRAGEARHGDHSLSPERAAGVPRQHGSEAERSRARRRAGERGNARAGQGRAAGARHAAADGRSARRTSTRTRAGTTSIRVTKSRSFWTRRCRVRRRRRARRRRRPRPRRRPQLTIHNSQLTNRASDMSRHRNHPDVVDRPRGGSGVRRGASCRTRSRARCSGTPCCSPRIRRRRRRRTRRRPGPWRQAARRARGRTRRSSRARRRPMTASSRCTASPPARPTVVLRDPKNELGKDFLWNTQIKKNTIGARLRRPVASAAAWCAGR